jgi:hypothetical protein
MKALRAVKVSDELHQILVDRAKQNGTSITEEAEIAFRAGLERLSEPGGARAFMGLAPDDPPIEKLDYQPFINKEKEDPPMISQMNDKVVENAQCFNCRNEVTPFKIIPATDLKKRVSTDFQIVYACTNPNCPKFGLLSVNFWYSSSDGANKVETHEVVPV